MLILFILLVIFSLFSKITLGDCPVSSTSDSFVVEDNGVSTNTPTEETWNGIKRDIPSDVIWYEYKKEWPHYGTGKWVIF
jgi:hypothetical protein